MTKAQKIIIIVAAVLIIATILYPPYYRIRSLISLELQQQSIMSKSGWEWIFDLNRIDETGGSGAVVHVRDVVRFDVLALEIIGILVLAGAALLVAKKK